MNNINTTIEEITPAKARYILENYNTSNRNLKPVWVENLAEMMRNGQFRMNGDAIRFDERGLLVDGQHRLSACVESGIPFKTVVVRNLIFNDVFPTIDNGAKRTNGDRLGILGVTHSTCVSAALRLYIAHKKTGNPFSNNITITTSDIIEESYKNPDIQKSAIFIYKHSFLKLHLSPSIGTFCHFLFTQKYKSSADSFFLSLATGENLPSDSSIFLLRNRLISARASKLSKLKNDYKCALVFKAFKIYATHGKTKFLRVRTSGEAPEVQVYKLDI